MLRPSPLILALSAAMTLGAAAEGRAPVADESANRARDGNIAIMEELVAARKAGTVEAYDLFIARHPDHALAEVARAERERLVAELRRR